MMMLLKSGAFVCMAILCELNVMSAIIENKRNIKRPRLERLKRFFRNEDGVVAIEFGAIAFPFFLLIIGTFETATVFMAGMALDHGMHRTARFVQTGQAADANLSEADFKAMVCDNAVMLPNCASTVKVDVRKFDDFTAATFPSMTQPDGELQLPEDLEYDIGTAESTVVVRVAYEWPILSSYINSGLGNMNNGNRLLIASWAFKNEPF